MSTCTYGPGFMAVYELCAVLTWVLAKGPDKASVLAQGTSSQSFRY
jgi:hypothetical protein